LTVPKNFFFYQNQGSPLSDIGDQILDILLMPFGFKTIADIGPISAKILTPKGINRIANISYGLKTKGH
jgi:hypothetical protein